MSMNNNNLYKRILGSMVLMFLASWGLYGVLIAANGFFDIFYIRNFSGRLLYAFARAIPGIIAFITAVMYGDIGGIKDYWGSYVKSRGRLRCFLILYLLFWVQITASLKLGRMSAILIDEFIMDLILLIPVVLLEEAAYRNYLFDSMDGKIPVFIASCVVGVFQGMIYLPLWFVRDSMQGRTSFGIYLTMVIFVSILLGFVKKITGSTLVCAIFAYLLNMLIEIFDGIIFENPKINIFYISEVILLLALYLMLKDKKNNITEDVQK